MWSHQQRSQLAIPNLLAKLYPNYVPDQNFFGQENDQTSVYQSDLRLETSSDYSIGSSNLSNFERKSQVLSEVCDKIITSTRSSKASFIYIVVPKDLSKDFLHYFPGYTIVSFLEFNNLRTIDKDSITALLIDVGDTQLSKDFIRSVIKFAGTFSERRTVIIIGTTVQDYCSNNRLKDFVRPSGFENESIGWNDIIFYGENPIDWSAFGDMESLQDLAVKILHGFHYKSKSDILCSSNWKSDITDNILVNLYYNNIINWKGKKIKIEEDSVKKSLEKECWNIQKQLCENFIQHGISTALLVQNIQNTSELHQKESVRLK